MTYQIHYITIFTISPYYVLHITIPRQHYILLSYYQDIPSSLYIPVSLLNVTYNIVSAPFLIVSLNRYITYYITFIVVMIWCCINKSSIWEPKKWCLMDPSMDPSELTIISKMLFATKTVKLLLKFAHLKL